MPMVQSGGPRETERKVRWTLASATKFLLPWPSPIHTVCAVFQRLYFVSRAEAANAHYKRPYSAGEWSASKVTRLPYTRPILGSYWLLSLSKYGDR